MIELARFNGYRITRTEDNPPSYIIERTIGTNELGVEQWTWMDGVLTDLRWKALVRAIHLAVSREENLIATCKDCPYSVDADAGLYCEWHHRMTKEGARCEVMNDIEFFPELEYTKEDQNGDPYKNYGYKSGESYNDPRKDSKEEKE